MAHSGFRSFLFTQTICNKDELWKDMKERERDNINGLT